MVLILWDRLNVDKQALAAPVKSAVDKFQLLPEFLKVHSSVLFVSLSFQITLFSRFYFFKKAEKWIFFFLGGFLVYLLVFALAWGRMNPVFKD